LESAQALAHQLARALTPEIDEVLISQTFLPFLWRSGALGGRRIRVFMTQLPIHILQQTLDRAYDAHPESGTLRDFRADICLLEDEQEALAEAEEILTPHAHLASYFSRKVTLLPWELSPPSRQVAQEPPQAELRTILFPASTLGRKGAYELREALQDLPIQLRLGGPVLEDPTFWNGFQILPNNPAHPVRADLVVLPAIVESQPRSLLRALAIGLPVMTTPESGLHSNCGANFVPSLDATSLRKQVEAQLFAID
jgi:hypothetical protein